MSDAPKDPRDSMTPGVLAESRLVNGLPGLGAFRVAPAGGAAVPEFLAGQATSVAWEQDGEVVTRWYSVASPPEQRDALDFLVVDAKGSGQGLFALEPGAPVWFGSCVGKLTLERTDCHHLVLLGTGTGLAPYLSMLRHLAARAAAGQPVPVAVALFHGARRGAELAFREELEALAAAQPFRFLYVPCVSRADEDADFDPARTTAGRADEAAARVLGLPSPGGDARGVRFPGSFDAEALGAILPADDTAVYLCGNPKMIDAFDAACDGTPRKERLVFERWW
jgi:ferredoxin-NADP reductase